MILSDLASSLKSKLAKFWKYLQSLSRHSRPACGSQVSATADDFNYYFLSMPYKTVTNVVSTVQPTEYMDRLFGRELQCVPLGVELVLLVISSLHASGADGQLIKVSPFMVRLKTTSALNHLRFLFNGEGYCHACS